MDKRIRTIVRLSRPVLFRNDNDKYRLAYGFVLDEDRVGDYDDRDAFDYVGILPGFTSLQRERTTWTSGK